MAWDNPGDSRALYMHSRWNLTIKDVLSVLNVHLYMHVHDLSVLLDLQRGHAWVYGCLSSYPVTT